uniref:5-methylcytosine restriction system specificity protein McrC n=1 Tax=Globicatella sulfidifaciens TaxID=136093 RepID=UPI0023F4601D|nr:5-methylcytosine-specific restriction endonuclease system specificity protein McrC [Globicatella sulfidifaciens]
MNEQTHYDWVDFYKEFASKLLDYKDNRNELVEKVKTIYSMTGMNMPTLEKENNLIDIDPFTVFGLFNKKLRDDNRIKILTAIANLFNIKTPVPTSFDCLPVLNPQYDNFSVDSTMNRIIKSTVELLLKADIAKSRKKELRKLMVFFVDVTPIDLYSVNWNMQYNGNNQSYQMLMSICYLVVKGLLQTNTDGTTKLMDFLDEQRMSRLYEKFILEYYKKHYHDISVSASQIPWPLDDGRGDMLPIMQTDIHLQKGNTVLIIDAKYYKNTTQVQYENHTLHSNNLYQIFTYVKNREYQFDEADNNVSGMLLYAKTDAMIQPDNVYQMHRNQISVKTLDLNLPFEQIASQLDKILEMHFHEVRKY